MEELKNKNNTWNDFLNHSRFNGVAIDEDNQGEYVIIIDNNRDKNEDPKFTILEENTKI